MRVRLHHPDRSSEARVGAHAKTWADPPVETGTWSRGKGQGASEVAMPGPVHCGKGTRVLTARYTRRGCESVEASEAIVAREEVQRGGDGGGYGVIRVKGARSCAGGCRSAPTFRLPESSRRLAELDVSRCELVGGAEELKQMVVGGRRGGLITEARWEGPPAAHDHYHTVVGPGCSQEGGTTGAETVAGKAGGIEAEQTSSVLENLGEAIVVQWVGSAAGIRAVRHEWVVLAQIGVACPIEQDPRELDAS